MCVSISLNDTTQEVEVRQLAASGTATPIPCRNELIDVYLCVLTDDRREGTSYT